MSPVSGSSDPVRLNQRVTPIVLGAVLLHERPGTQVLVVGEMGVVVVHHGRDLRRPAARADGVAMVVAHFQPVESIQLRCT